MSKKILIGWMVAALLMMTGCGGSISAMLSNLDLDLDQGQEQDQDQDQGQDQDQDQDQIVQCDAVPGYAYSQLSQVEQEIYLRLLAVVTGRQQQLTDLPGEMSSAWMGEMVQAVLADHPGIFWFNGSGELTQKRSLWGKSCVFVPQYLYTGEQILRRQQQIEKKTADFLAAVDVQAGDYERALTAYEYVIQNTDYVLGAMDNQNICSVFLNGQSVCTGYAKAFQYLLQKLGIEAAYVTGQIIQTGEKHAWVLMKLAGQYYYADPTFGDPLFQGDLLFQDGQEMMVSGISYAWFGLTTAELEITHKLAATRQWPRCGAVCNNYYQAEGLFLESYDRQTIGKLLSRAVAAGKPIFSCKFANQQLYRQACQDLLEDEAIFSLLKQARGHAVGAGESLYYDCMDQKWIITVYL